MIVKRNLAPRRVLGYIWRPLLYATAVAVVVVVAAEVSDSDRFALPFLPVGTLGAALAIFVAFRNNASYARWWEARTLWAGVQANSRILARQVVAATTNALATGSGGQPTEVRAYAEEVVLRLVAFAHALRIELRGGDDWTALAPLLPAEEHRRLLHAQNRPNLLLHHQGVRLKDGVREGKLGQFDPITLEPNLAALNNWAAGCERIKRTPTPRQYDYFTRLAVATFSTLLPFGLLGVLPEGRRWQAVPLAVLLSTVFIVLERVGAVVEAPFEDQVTDIPMTAICTDIERDLREQLGQGQLPAPEPVRAGYLW